MFSTPALTPRSLHAPQERHNPPRGTGTLLPTMPAPNLPGTGSPSPCPPPALQYLTGPQAAKHSMPTSTCFFLADKMILLPNLLSDLGSLPTKGEI